MLKMGSNVCSIEGLEGIKVKVLECSLDYSQGVHGLLSSFHALGSTVLGLLSLVMYTPWSFSRSIDLFKCVHRAA